MTTPLFVGIRGCVLAIDRASGQEIWRAELRGMEFVNVVLDGGDVFASTRGRLYCLDQATGAIKWENPLTGLGWGIVCIANSGVVPAAERRRQQQQQAAAGAAVAASAS